VVVAVSCLKITALCHLMIIKLVLLFYYLSTTVLSISSTGVNEHTSYVPKKNRVSFFGFVYAENYLFSSFFIFWEKALSFLVSIFDIFETQIMAWQGG